MQPEHEAEHLSPLNDEVKNVWSHSSGSPDALMALLLVKQTQIYFVLAHSQDVRNCFLSSADY
jgi:hypothetical protein